MSWFSLAGDGYFSFQLFRRCRHEFGQINDLDDYQTFCKYDSSKLAFKNASIRSKTIYSSVWNY
tara:strand:- start:43 stop:234 length:192 start_codon:yes stop_codon:yes gene_type:complete